MAEGARLALEYSGCDFIDINMGCPMPKIAQSGDGCGLMRTPELAGDIVKADVFAAGDAIDVVGTSKGKGFQGSIKRHNQARLRMTHGTGPVHRESGSMGANSDPSRVFKGKALPGHMGAEQVTVQNLEVVKVDVENNLIAIKGAIPGPRNGYVFISDSVKA